MLRVPVSVFALAFVAVVVQTVFSDLLLRAPQPYEHLSTLANPRVVTFAASAGSANRPDLCWVPFAAFAILCTFVPARWRLPAFAGALIGYLAGWSFFSSVITHGSAFWLPWAYRVVAIGVASGLTFTLFEPIVEVCETWLARPRQFAFVAVATGAVGVVFAYPVAAEYIDGRLAFRIDREHMMATYRAIVLYEADYDGQAPKSLPDLVPTHLAAGMLNSPVDPRPKHLAEGYPADLFVFRRREYARYVPFRVSYAYARSFERTLIAEQTWEEIRARKDFGLLVNTQHTFLESKYRSKDYDLHKDHGFPTDKGPIMRVTMDGSLLVLQKTFEWVGSTPEGLFYSARP